MDTKLPVYVAQVRAHLHTAAGKQRRRELMLGRGWPYDRFVAESVCYVTRLVIYEKIQAVTTQVILEELSAEPARVGA